MKKAIVFLAEGFEEVEALTSVDLLRRAGVKTETVAIGEGEKVTSSGGITVTADGKKAEVNLSDADLMVLPGGMPGTRHLAESAFVKEALKVQNEKNGLIGAICAAPALVLGEGGFLKEKKATCYPGMEAHLKDAHFTEDAVAQDGNIITSRGVGTAIPFALCLIENLCGKEKAAEIAKNIVFSHSA